MEGPSELNLVEEESAEFKLADQYFLHGTLEVTFSKEEEQNTTGNGLRGRGKRFWRWLKKQVFRLKYAAIDLEKETDGISLRYQRCITPAWNEVYPVYCGHVVSKITVKLYGTYSSMRSVEVPLAEILGEPNEASVFVRFHGQSIKVKLKFFHVTRDHSASWESGVPNTYFPQREKCQVSLYQDAHVASDFSTGITLDGGLTYQPQRCWEDIFKAINDAEKIIYIAGWCVHPEITLVRDTTRQSPGINIKLGDLLKEKANKGVTVLILIWHEKGSWMGTRSKETEKYFRGTGVHCVACTRKSDVGVLSIDHIIKAWLNSHHQKTVVVDVRNPRGDPGSDQRKIVAFVGGIDLCGGRYDTQHHSLFSTLNSEHKHDFYQGNFPGSSIEKGGPREPWHDIHAQVEGPAALDIKNNFEKRWLKQGKKHVSPRNLQGGDIIPESDYSQLAEDKKERYWNAQVFRSINGASAAGLPNNYCESSIHDAYINAIRRADNFIYIETQYFLGSSYAWTSTDGLEYKEVSVENLIPKEISLKIISKIEAGEPFTVYIVLPMWPEHELEDPYIMDILDTQCRTMQMMYEEIAASLKGKDQDPRDYLTFFCLGNREVMHPCNEHKYDPSPERPEKDSNYWRAQEARRFMIYVHSKMMIVDDKYIIVGSSNINDRSMDGARDTEIAIGTYQLQPNNLASTSGNTNNNLAISARGQIHGFRMSLWFEHLGKLEPCFDNPESKECVQEVNRLADANWERYSGEELCGLDGHLLRYPVNISKEDGTITALEGHECFPDTNVPVLGKARGYFLSAEWDKALLPHLWRLINYVE